MIKQKSFNQVVSERIDNYCYYHEWNSYQILIKEISDDICKAISSGEFDEELSKMGYRKVKEVPLNIDDRSLPMSIVLPDAGRLVDGDTIFISMEEEEAK